MWCQTLLIEGSKDEDEDGDEDEDEDEDERKRFHFSVNPNGERRQEGIKHGSKDNTTDDAAGIVCPFSLLVCPCLDEVPFSHPSSDHLFKLMLIGDTGVGKSCLLLRFAV